MAPTSDTIPLSRLAREQFARYLWLSDQGEPGDRRHDPGERRRADQREVALRIDDGG